MAKQKKTTPPPAPKPPKVDTKGLKALETFNQNYEKEQKQQILNSKELSEIAEELTGTWSDLSKAIQEINKRSEALGDNFDEIVDYTKSIYANMENIGNEYYEQVDISGKLNKLEKERDKRNDNYLEMQSELQKIQKKMMAAEAAGKKDRAGLLSMRADELKLAMATQRREVLSLATRVNALKTLESTAAALDKANEVANKTGLDIQEVSKDLTEPFEKVLGFLDKVPGGGILKNFLGVDKKLESVQKSIMDSFVSGLANGQSTGTAAFGALRAGATSFMAALGPILVPLLAISAALYLIKKLFDFDKETVELAKNLDVSKKEAIGIHHAAVEISQEMNVVGVNSEQVTKVMTEMKKTMGFNVGLMAEHNEHAKQLVSTTTLLVEKQGLTVEEASALNTASIATGVSLQNMALMAESVGDELVSGRDVMQELGKVSKSVLINFSKQPEKLVAAVKKAKALGTTLDAINKAGESMLDIESSLESQYKAQVLLGKNINLNAAREAALRGDTATLMEEISEQAGSAAEYEKLAPLQRKALAEALGMQVDQMDEMMLKQKELEALGYSQAELDEKLKLTGTERAAELERIRDLKGEEAAKALEAKYNEEDRVALMDKLSDIGDKLMDSMSQIFGPLLDIIGPIFDIVSGIAEVFMGVINPIIKDISDTFKELFGSAEGTSEIFKTIGNIIGMLIMVPMRGVLTVINTIKEQIKGVMEIFSGIGDLFSGNFADGFAKIGKGLIRIVLSPIQAGIDMVLSFVNMIIDGLNKIPGVELSQVGPFNLTDMTGLKNGGTVGTGGMALVGEAGPEVVSLPSSATVTSNDDSGGIFSKIGDLITGAESNAGAGGANAVSLATVNASIQELIKKVSQPTVIKFGSKTVEEFESQINMKKSYTSQIDRGYGATS